MVHTQFFDTPASIPGGGRQHGARMFSIFAMFYPGWSDQQAGLDGNNPTCGVGKNRCES
jgi:hypothetical protein